MNNKVTGRPTENKEALLAFTFASYIDERNMFDFNLLRKVREEKVEFEHAFLSFLANIDPAIRLERMRHLLLEYFDYVFCLVGLSNAYIPSEDANEMPSKYRMVWWRGNAVWIDPMGCGFRLTGDDAHNLLEAGREIERFIREGNADMGELSMCFAHWFASQIYRQRNMGDPDRILSAMWRVVHDLRVQVAADSLPCWDVDFRVEMFDCYMAYCELNQGSTKSEHHGTQEKAQD